MRGLGRSGRVRTAARVVTILAALVASPACYTYTRVPVDAAVTGESLRLLVTSDGADDLRRATNTDAVAPTFEGALTGRESGALLLRVPVTNAAQASPSSVRIDQVVRVPIDEILSVERKQVSPLKTGFMIAAATTVGTVLVIKIMDAGGLFGREPEDPDFSLAVFRLPIG